MALITSAQSGNFNDTATWTGGVVPTVGDEARAATGHTITITADATCADISISSGSGYFVINDGVTLTSNVTLPTGLTGPRSVLVFTASAPAVANVVGNISGPSTLAVTSDSIRNVSTGTLNIVGTVTGGMCASNNGGNGHVGIMNASTGTVNIVGSVVGGGGGTTNNQGVRNASTGLVSIVGSCTASSSAPAVINSSTGTVSIVGTLQASQVTGAVTGTSTQQVTILSGPFLTETTRGVAAVYCAAWRWNASPSNSTYMEVMTNNLLAKRNLYTADNVTGMPAASNVKSGVQYGPSSELTGTLATTTSPSASDIRDAVWGAATSGMTTSGSIGERLKNASTLATTGQQIADAMSA